MSKKSNTVVENTEVVEVKAEKTPSAKQTMLKRWHEFVSCRKSFNEKFNPNFPAVYATNPKFIDKVCETIAKLESEFAGFDLTVADAKDKTAA